MFCHSPRSETTRSHLKGGVISDIVAKAIVVQCPGYLPACPSVPATKCVASESGKLKVATQGAGTPERYNGKKRKYDDLGYGDYTPLLEKWGSGTGYLASHSVLEYYVQYERSAE